MESNIKRRTILAPVCHAPMTPFQQAAAKAASGLPLPHHINH